MRETVPDLPARSSWPPLPERYAAALRQAVAWVLAEVDATGIVAAGTVVRGAPHAASDLDLCVLHDAPRRRRVQRWFGDSSHGPLVPAETFVNPPTAVRGFFEWDSGFETVREQEAR